MIRRLFSILYLVSMLPIGIIVLVSYITFPLWLLVWLFTNWWIYPWGNAVLHNISNWIMVRSAEKRFSGRLYTKADYQNLKLIL